MTSQRSELAMKQLLCASSCNAASSAPVGRLPLNVTRAAIKSPFMGPAISMVDELDSVSMPTNASDVPLQL